MSKKAETVKPLKKPRSPLSVGNIFLGILVFLVLTVVAIYVTAFIMGKTTDFVGISKDLSQKLGMTDFFTKVANWFK